MKILLIEDDKKLCELLQFQLEQEKHQVDLCHDGRDGLELFLQDAYDLVLLDRMLPTMNGLVVLKKARSAGLTTPVILLTALGELYDRIEGLDGGADDYMVKPFEFEELSARIRSIGRRSENGRRTPCSLMAILLMTALSACCMPPAVKSPCLQERGFCSRFFCRSLKKCCTAWLSFPGSGA